MKKFLFTAIASLLLLGSCNNKPSLPIKQEVKENVRFRMFPTENIWTFLKLDTKTGKIWQVQYSLEEGNRGEVILNDIVLANGSNAENGRFTLYPTKNMFNFILLDQIDGKMWQAQWSMEEENRGLVPINDN